MRAPDDRVLLPTRDPYVVLARTRAERIQRTLAEAEVLPEPPAETLSFAAASLAHVDGLHGAPPLPATAAHVARRLTLAARRLDPRRSDLAERALGELEATRPAETAMRVREAANALVWAAAVLRHLGARLAETEDGNAEHLELSSLCLQEAGRFFMSCDAVTPHGAGADVR